MSGKRSIFLCVLISLLLVRRAQSLVSDGSQNPYQGITDRNVFALRPPPPPPPPPPIQQLPVKITLNGIITIGGKRALLKAQIPAHPPEPAKEEFYILRENQSEGDIEVVAIDDKAGTVKVKNHGTPQTLDFENNGAKLPAASTLPIAPTLPAPAMAQMAVPPPTAPAPKAAEPALSHDQQTALIELERERLLQSGDDTYRIMPMTDMTPAPGTSIFAQ